MNESRYKNKKYYMRPDIAINIIKFEMNAAQQDADEFRATANLDNYKERFVLFDLELM